MENNNLNGETKFRNWLNKEAAYAVAIIIPTLGILGYLNSLSTKQALLEQSIRNIETNHIAHIQDSVAKIEEEQKLERSDVVQIKTDLAEIKALLRQK